jgi:hypothetical protein
MQPNNSNNNNQKVLKYQNYLKTSFLNPTKIVKFFQTLNLDTQTKQTAKANLVGANRIMKEAKEVFNTPGVISDDYRNSISNLKEVFKYGATTNSIKYASDQVDMAKNVINLLKTTQNHGSSLADYFQVKDVNISPFIEASAKKFVYNKQNLTNSPDEVSKNFVQEVEKNWNNTIFTQDDEKNLKNQILHAKETTHQTTSLLLDRGIEEEKFKTMKSYVSQNQESQMMTNDQTDFIKNNLFQNTNSFLKPEGQAQTQNSHRPQSGLISEDNKNNISNLLKNVKNNFTKMLDSAKIVTGITKPPSFQELVKQELAKRKQEKSNTINSPTSLPANNNSNKAPTR